jgi:hypothetical protein
MRCESAGASALVATPARIVPSVKPRAGDGPGPPRLACPHRLQWTDGSAAKGDLTRWVLVIFLLSPEQTDVFHPQWTYSVRVTQGADVQIVTDAHRRYPRP